MKKLSFFLVALLATCALGFSGCSDDDTETPTSPPVIKAEGISVSATALVGKVLYTIENPIEGHRITAASDKEWIHDFVTTVADQITFAVDRNTGDERTATLTLSYTNAQNVTVTVRQMAAGESIQINPNILTFTYQGGTESVTVTSGKDWTLTGGAEWITASKDKGSDGDTVEFTVEAVNETDEPLQTTFTFTCGKETATLNVSQNMEGRILVEQATYDVGVEGGPVAIKLQANADDVTFTIPETCPWVTVGDGSRAMVEKTFNFTVAANDTEEPRTAVITFKNLEAIEHVTIEQAGPMPSNILDAVKDPYFKSFLQDNIEAAKDGELTPEEAQAITTLEISGEDYMEEMQSLEGIEYFTELTSLIVTGSQKLQTVDLSKNTKLEEINFGSCKYLKTLNMSGCTAVKKLYFVACPRINKLDVTMMPNLEYLVANSAVLTAVDVTNNPKLKEISVAGSFTSVDLSQNPDLEKVTLSSEALLSIDVTNSPKLELLSVKGAKLIADVDVTNNSKLQELDVANTAIAALDLSKNIDLRSLTIDVCNNITALDVSNNLKLTKLSAYSDGFGVLPKFRELIMTTGQVITTTNGIDPEIITITYVDMPYPDDCAAIIEDANLKAYVLATYDDDKDGKISETEALKVTAINAPSKNIASLEGLTYFTNLTSINLANNALTAADLSLFGKITSLDLSNNQLVTLDFVRTPNIETLDVSNNQLTSVNNLSNVKALVTADLSHNQLTGLNASYLSKMVSLDVSHNLMENSQYGQGGLGVSENAALKTLNFSYNNLYAIKVWSLVALETLDCSYNPLMEGTNSQYYGLGDLLHENVNLVSLNCSGTAATELNLESHTKLNQLIVLEMPNAVTVELGSVNPADLQVGSNVTVNKGGDPEPGLPIDATNFPDAAFRTAVEALDTDGNGQLSDAEIAAAKSLTLQNATIASLTGLEKLTALESLMIKNVQGATTLDLKSNTALRELRLQYGSGERCNFTTIDLSECSQLTTLMINAWSSYCDLKKLDISKNSNLIIDDQVNFYVPGSLTEIIVSEAQYQPVYNLFWGSWDRYETTITKAGSGPAPEGLAINATNFPDPNFRTAVKTAFDTNGDGALSDSELANAKSLKVENVSVTSLTGIEKLTALESLELLGATTLTTLDLTTNPGLLNVRITGYTATSPCALTSIDLTGCPALTVFYFNIWPSPCNVSEIDFTGNPNLRFEGNDFSYFPSSLNKVIVTQAQKSGELGAWFNSKEYYDMMSMEVK